MASGRRRPGRASNSTLSTVSLQLDPLALGLVGAAPRQDDDELVAGVADADVVRTDGATQHGRHFAQRAVADVVAVAVVDFLEAVEVHHEQRHFGLEAFGARQLAREVHEHEARVRQARQRVGQRIFLGLLEHDRVVNHGGRLLADAIEEAAVIVGVEIRLRRVDRQRADEAIVEDERRDQGGLQRGGLGGQPGRLELGARSRVHQRPAIARHPAGQALAAADDHRADHLGFGAGGETALQRFDVLVVEEQRARRERHEVRQLRRNERHRVGHAEAGAHRLRDLVERVDFAVGERDVFEHRAALDRPALGLEADRRTSEIRGRFERQPARRRGVDGPGGDGHFGHHRHEHLDDGRVEGASGFLLQERDRGIVRHRLVIRTIGCERVEVVDDREDTGAQRDLVALEALRITLAVPALVVAEDQRSHRVRKRHRADDLGAHLRVHADLLELFLRQRSGFRQDVLRHGELADVVQQGGGLDTLDLGLGHPESLGDTRRIDLHAANVRLGGLILGVDGERERFDRGQVEVGHLLDVAALIVDAAQVHLVAAIRDVERSGGQQRRPHAGIHHRPRGDRGSAGSHEVARCAPEKILVPDADERLPGRERHRDCDQAGIEDEIRRRRRDERDARGRRSCAPGCPGRRRASRRRILPPGRSLPDTPC